MKFKVNHTNKTVQVSMFETNEVIKQAGISASNLGYSLVMTLMRTVSAIKKAA
jgi:hypothetical protein